MSGIEWLVEAFGCAESGLRDRATLSDLFHVIVSEMNLKPVGEPVWHQFPTTGGITGIWLLRESHLAIHSFPEFRSACLNLFCCTERRSLDWSSRLEERLGATRVRVSQCRRPYGSPDDEGGPAPR